MKFLSKFARQIVVSIIGFPLLVVGIILIPLPGPGILISFIALFILSWGFEWAEKYVEKCKDIFRKIYATAKERADKIEKSGK